MASERETDPNLNEWVPKCLVDKFVANEAKAGRGVPSLGAEEEWKSGPVAETWKRCLHDIDDWIRVCPSSNMFGGYMFATWGDMDGLMRAYERGMPLTHELLFTALYHDHVGMVAWMLLIGEKMPCECQVIKFNATTFQPEDGAPRLPDKPRMLDDIWRDDTCNRAVRPFPHQPWGPFALGKLMVLSSGDKYPPAVSKMIANYIALHKET